MDDDHGFFKTVSIRGATVLESSTRTCLHDSIMRPKSTALPKTVKLLHPFSWRSVVESESHTAVDPETHLRLMVLVQKPVNHPRGGGGVALPIDRDEIDMALHYRPFLKELS